MSECFHIQLRKQYKPLHMQSASRFESVLLASIKALQSISTNDAKFTEFSIPSLPLFSVEQVSHASAHVIQASIQF
jgi:hypothetical protein